MHATMRPLLMIAFLVITGCAAPPPPAAEIAPPPAPAQLIAANEPRAAESEEVVCYKERATGTRFAKEVCRKRSDMNQQSRDAQRSMKDMDRKSANGSDPLMGGN